MIMAGDNNMKTGLAVIVLRTFARPALGALALLGGAPALAHHSSAMWDDTRSIELHGTIKEFEWTNPHVWIWLVVEDRDGVQRTWGVEAGAVNSMRRQGWSRDALTVGEQVVITVHPRRDGARQGDSEVGSLAKITRADGTPVPANQGGGPGGPGGAGGPG